MHISPRRPGLVSVEHNGTRYLGVHTSLAVRGIAPAALESASRPALEVEGDVIRDWQIVGRVAHLGTLVFYGPDRAVRPLVETLGTPDGEARLRLLCNAIRLFQNRGMDPGLLELDLVLVSDSGGLLFISRELVESLLPRAREELAPEASYSLPELTGESALSATVMALAYRHICGAWPVSAGDPAERRDRMRRGLVDDPAIRAPALAPATSAELQRLCSRGFRASLPLSEALSATEGLLAVELHQDGPRQHEDAVREARLRAARRKDMGYRARRFLGNRWRALIAGSLLAAFVLSIPLGLIRGALAPPVTAGLGPEAVIREFYSALSALDRETMTDATWRNAGGPLVDLATNLFVIGRVRASVEFRDPFVPAQTWLDLPEDSRERGTIPVGVVDLELVPLGSEEDTREYRVEYVLYVPAEGTGPDNLPVSEAAGIVETVRVERRRGNWYITEILRQSTEPN